MIKIYCYNKCSTCRKALKFLDEHNVEYNLKDIKEDYPTAFEMTEIIKRSNLEIKKFFNTSGNVYKKLNLKDKLEYMDDESKINLLTSNGMLIKRPLVVTSDTILVGFKEELWNSLINK